MATFGQLIQFGPFFSGGLLTTLKVYHYSSGTVTLKDVYTDREKTTAAAQPALSDANGIASFYADGLYKFRIDGATDGSTYSTLYTYDKWAVGDQSLVLSGEGAAIASASTLTLGTDGDFFHVTGSTGPIIAISGTQTHVTLVFDSTPTLTHSGNLVLYAASSVVVTANDVFRFVNDGSDVWREVSRTSSAQLLQNSKSAAYTTVIGDSGKHLLHPTADNNARTFTIDSNANVAYPIGTAITFVNQINTLSIAITADTLTFAGPGTTGTRTLAASGVATALKVSTTGWIISGVGLS